MAARFGNCCCILVLLELLSETKALAVEARRERVRHFIVAVVNGHKMYSG